MHTKFWPQNLWRRHQMGKLDVDEHLVRQSNNSTKRRSATNPQPCAHTPSVSFPMLAYAPTFGILLWPGSRIWNFLSIHKLSTRLHVSSQGRFSLYLFLCCTHLLRPTRGGAVVWRTALQVTRSQVRFPMVPLEFFIVITLPATLWHWGPTRPLKVR
jgi:hypothetical protein